MSGPTFGGKKSTISVDFRRTVDVGGLKIRVELEPGCWVRGARLGLMARHPVAGSARLLSRRTFEQATPADLDRMIRRLRIVKCRVRGCTRPNLVGDGKEPGNPKAYCERHRLKDIVTAAAKIQAEIDVKQAIVDAAWRGKGYRYKATIWIHRDDCNDSAVVLYLKGKPTPARLRQEARRRKSRVLDDAHVERL
jgi:hypothetical protein